MDFSGIDKLTIIDFPSKVACILFYKGCNFRCPYCHNSSLVDPLKKVDTIPFNEILSFLKKRQGILDGVVISGGEPTLMKDLKEKIIEIRKLGFLIKLDTNGSNPEILMDLVNSKLVDYVAMDIKNSLKMYGKTIGLSNFTHENILKSINFLKENHCDYEFRTTLVNELFSEESIKEMGETLKGGKRLFLQKFVKSNECLNANFLSEVNEKDVQKYQKILLNYIDEVYLRGY